MKCWSYCCTPWSLSTFSWFWHSVSIFHRRSRPGLPWIRNVMHISQTLTLNLRMWVCCMIYHIIGFSNWYNWESSWISLNTFCVSTDSQSLLFNEHEIKLCFELLCFLAADRAKTQFFPLYSLLLTFIVGWCWNQCWKLNLASEKDLYVKKAIWIFFHRNVFLNIFSQINYNIFTNQRKTRFFRMRVEYTTLMRKRTNNNNFKKILKAFCSSE